MQELQLFEAFFFQKLETVAVSYMILIKHGISLSSSEKWDEYNLRSLIRKIIKIQSLKFYPHFRGIPN